MYVCIYGKILLQACLIENDRQEFSVQLFVLASEMLQPSF